MHIKDGEVDLNSWNFKINGNMELNGEWAVVWDRFLEIEDIAKIENHKYVDVPSLWDQPERMATYYLRLDANGLKMPSQLSFVLNEASPSKVEVFRLKDRQSLGTVNRGFPATNRIYEVPDRRISQTTWNIDPEESYLIVVQMSNFSYARGGFWSAPILGLKNQIQNKIYTDLIKSSLLLGSIFVFGIYHLLVFVIRRRSLSALYFSIFCFFVFTRETLLSRLPQNIGLGGSQGNFEFLMKLEIMSIVVISLACILFVSAVIIPEKIYKQAFVILGWIGSVILAYILLVPVKEAGHALIIVQAHLTLCLVSLVFHIINSIRLKKPYSKEISLTFVVVFLGTMNDVLYYREIVETGDLSATSFIAFLLGQSIILAKKSADAYEKATHSYRQLAKVFYPHQIHRIEKGIELESTMPTEHGEGIVISFDVIGSSQIKHIKLKEFLENSIHSCIELLSQNYRSETMSANGYRIKEVGDGFLCSIGYPFSVPEGKEAADLAVELSYGFISRFEKVVSEYNMKNIHCGIGISFGALQGYFPRTGTKEYDIFGRGIVLATRYESMRKFIFPNPDSHSIILQSIVYNSLSARYRSRFSQYDIPANKKVRDDPDATELYYELLSYQSGRDKEEKYCSFKTTGR